jgi:hypothetical protein
MLPRMNTRIATKGTMVIVVFTGTKLLVLDALPPEQKFNQNHFLAMNVPKSLKGNTNVKRRVGHSQLVVHMNNFVCHTWRKIREYFARKTVMKVPHPVYSPTYHRVLNN